MRRFASFSFACLIGCGARTALDVSSSAKTEGGALTSAVLFGGYDLADTWTWDGASWAQRDVTGPSARDNAMMAGFGGDVFLFGGAGTDQGQPDVVLSDTWRFDGSTWTQLTPATRPSARASAGMASRGSELVVFGGNPGAPSTTPLADTWTFDGTTWTQHDVKGPAARVWPMMAPLGDAVVVLFGGQDFSEDDFGDTWSWNGSAWTELKVSGPVARSSAVMASVGGKIVLFGGLAASGALADTWTFDGAAWTNVNVAGPAARSSAAFAVVAGKLVVYGGDPSVGGALDDTWTWDGAAWIQLVVPSPPAREASSMAAP
jgi:N-acetylneuraminic acid mutarotase